MKFENATCLNSEKWKKHDLILEQIKVKEEKEKIVLHRTKCSFGIFIPFWNLSVHFQVQNSSENKKYIV